MVRLVDGQTIEEYKLEPMRDDHALQHFREHAFKGKAPEGVSVYDSLSVDIVKAIDQKKKKDIVKAVGGLPSDVVDHASELGDHVDIDVRKSTLE